MKAKRIKIKAPARFVDIEIHPDLNGAHREVEAVLVAADAVVAYMASNRSLFKEEAFAVYRLKAEVAALRRKTRPRAIRKVLYDERAARVLVATDRGLVAISGPMKGKVVRNWRPA